MSRIGIRITTVGAAAAGLATAFLAMSPTAAADPVAPVAPAAPAIPGIPGMENIIQQLAAAPERIPQMLQSAASAFGGAPQAPAASTAPAPGATASINLPQAAGAPSVPPVSTTGVTPSQVTTPAMNVPMPQMNQLPLGNLASLGQGLGLPTLGAPSTGSTTPAGLPGLIPSVPGVPDGNPLAALNPLSALP